MLLTIASESAHLGRLLHNKIFGFMTDNRNANTDPTRRSNRQVRPVERFNASAPTSTAPRQPRRAPRTHGPGRGADNGRQDTARSLQRDYSSFVEMATAELYYEPSAPISEAMGNNVWIHSIRPASYDINEMNEGFALAAWGNEHMLTGNDWEELAAGLKVTVASLLGFAPNHLENRDFMQQVRLRWLMDIQHATAAPTPPALDIRVALPVIDAAITALAE